MTLLFLVNIKDIKVTFSQNVLYHMEDDLFCKKQQITKKLFSWVLTERATYFEQEGAGEHDQ